MRRRSRRIFLQSAKSVAARVEREHHWPAKTLHSEGRRLVGTPARLVARQLNEAARRQERFRLGCTSRVRHAFPYLG